MSTLTDMALPHVLQCSGYETINTDIVEAHGCYLFDSQHKRYVDFEAGVWCTALGHGHPRVNQAIHRQMEQITHISLRAANSDIETAAVTVLDTIPLHESHNNKCVFLSSGSEAVEFGVQIARQITRKPLLLTLSNSYLAALGSAGSKNPAEWYCVDWTTTPDLRQIPFGDIAGFIFEPGSTSGLVKFPPTDMVQSLVKGVRQHGGLVVVDEVTTGLGRTGTWYGFQHYDFQPDIVALGKGLGNGYPVSAVAMTGDVASRLAEIGFHYAQSHQNDPLSCAVAREVITVLHEERLVARSQQMGQRFVQGLEQLAARHRQGQCAIKAVRGRGLMIAVEFESGTAGGINPALTTVYRQLIERGFWVGFKPAANVLRFYPPLIIAEEDIAALLDNLDDILEKMG